MKTLVDIDERLLTKAMALSDSATKRETMQRALEELIRACRRRELKALAGSGIVDMTLPELRRARRRGQVHGRRVR
ncbi:type II toxin-antitoxin system VapB family antitoxin [Nitrospira sp. Kam-Ns4a]